MNLKLFFAVKTQNTVVIFLPVCKTDEAAGFDGAHEFLAEDGEIKRGKQSVNDRRKKDHRYKVTAVFRPGRCRAVAVIGDQIVTSGFVKGCDPIENEEKNIAVDARKKNQ